MVGVWCVGLCWGRKPGDALCAAAQGTTAGAVCPAVPRVRGCACACFGRSLRSTHVPEDAEALLPRPAILYRRAHRACLRVQSSTRAHISSAGRYTTFLGRIQRRTSNALASAHGIEKGPSSATLVAMPREMRNLQVGFDATRGCRHPVLTKLRPPGVQKLLVRIGCYFVCCVCDVSAECSPPVRSNAS